MPRIDVADDLGSWMQLRPDMGEGLVAFSSAVYGKARLPLREREIARMRIAQLNECEVCRNTRQSQGAAQGVDEALYANAEHWRSHGGYSPREKLAAEFAERFAQDHIALRADDAFWRGCARPTRTRRSSSSACAARCGSARGGCSACWM